MFSFGADYYSFLFKEVGTPHGYIITCPLHSYKNNKKSTVFWENIICCLHFLPFVSVPIAVSLVEKDCDAATNILSVTYEPLKDGQQKQEIAVCVKVWTVPCDRKWVRLLKYFFF